MKAVTELWAPVLINDGIFKDTYLVSNMGRVLRKQSRGDGNYKYITVKIINSRRPSVRITGGGKEYRKSVAKLVLSSFNYREGCECANITYLDGNMKNCELSNLRYTVDKTVCTTDKLIGKKLAIKVEEPVSVKAVPVKISDTTVLLRSCSTCCKDPCFKGKENMSSDFGASGCRKYKPRETDQ